MFGWFRSKKKVQQAQLREPDMDMAFGINVGIILNILLLNNSVNLQQMDLIVTTLRKYAPDKDMPAKEIVYILTDKLAFINGKSKSVASTCRQIEEYSDKAGLGFQEKSEMVIDASLLGMFSDTEGDQFANFIDGLRHHLGITDEIVSSDHLVQCAEFYNSLSGSDVESPENIEAHKILNQALSRTTHGFPL